MSIGTALVARRQPMPRADLGGSPAAEAAARCRPVVCTRLGFALLTAEVALVIAAELKPRWIPLLLAAHAAIVAILATALTTAARAPARLRLDRAESPQQLPLPRLDLILLLFTALLGPLGVLGAGVIAVAVGRVEAHPSAPPRERILKLARGHDATHALARRLRHQGRRAALAVPFIDLILGGNLEQKQAVIALVDNVFQPQFAPILREALNDGEPTVRVMAASALARLENEFLAASIALEEASAEARESTLAKMRLAHHFDIYANSGLLDAGRTAAARARALDLYRECLGPSEHRGRAANLLVRLLVRMGRAGEAVERYGDAAAGGPVMPELLAWYLESLYCLRRFEVLRRTCRDLLAAASGLTPLPERCHRSIELWGGGATR